MGGPIRVVVVDDEELARARIKGLLEAFDDLECVGEAENGLEAVERIRELGPDLVFLDIQMPGMDGFEVLAALDDVPLVIFATAYDEYALRAFEVNSIDYLLKPIEKERLAQAVERARELLSGENELGREIERIVGLVRTRGVDRLPVQRGKKIVLVDHANIVWVEASEGLVFVHTRDQRFLVLKTRRIAGQRTLILQGSRQTTFGVPVAWTDRAPPDPDATTPTILHANSLQTLADLVEQLLHPTAETPKKGVAK